MSPITALLSTMSPAGSECRLTIFIFHRVLPQLDPIFPSEVDAFQFGKMMGWVKHWFNVLPLDSAVRRLRNASLPARAAAITFDDGYLDNLAVAMPILKHHGLTATFFIATGYLDGGRMWNDTVIESVRACPLPALDLSELGLGRHPTADYAQKRTTIEAVIRQIKYLPVLQRAQLADHIAQVVQVEPPGDLMMASAQVLSMHRAGMQIGAHTVTHPILSLLTDEQARQEIQGSKHFLEQLLGERVGLFAYPNGKPGEDYTPATVEVVRGLDFDAAVSTQWGASGVDADLLELRRFTPWDRNKLRFGARLVSNLRKA